jgi:hypothetical protein
MLLNSDPYIRGKHKAYLKMLRDKNDQSTLLDAPVFDRLSARATAPPLMR